MAFVTPTRPGRFELRESRSTPKGPRSRTLVSFRELDDEAIRKAQARSTNSLDPAELKRAARRAGAPIARAPIDRAARELIAELGRGRQPDPTLRHMLLDLLQHGFREGGEPTTRREAEHSVAEWMAATPEERGRALVDLLLLADALPHGGRKDKPLRFPRLDSTNPMTAPLQQAPLEEAPHLPDKVIAIHESLLAAKIPHALGGALALAYYATPRATIDVDLNVFVPTERWQEVIAALEPLGIATEDLDVTALERDGRCRLWWGDNAVDLFFAYDPLHQEMKKQARRVPFGGATVPILAPEHLAVCKAMFDRRKDWLDIEQMLVVDDELDLALVEKWLERMVGRRDQRLAHLAELRAATPLEG